MEAFFEMWDTHLNRTMFEEERARPTKEQIKQYINNCNNILNDNNLEEEERKFYQEKYECWVYALMDIEEENELGAV